MPKLQDLTGFKFGHLTVIRLDENSTSKHRKWHCKCDCGNHTSIFGTNLKRGVTTSCGCQSSRNNASKLKEINTKHGMSRSKLYHAYYGVLARCTKENSQAYKHYGARGITICEEWKNSFDIFRDWAMSNGYHEGLTLERVNNDKGYSPDNCKWITQSEQTLNKRTTLYATINGETKTLKEWSVVSGIKYSTLRSRLLRYGWTGEKILSKPTPYHRN